MSRRVLLLVPHPDDEVVGCAAAIERDIADGTAFHALYLTTGVPPRAALWPWQRRGYAGRVARRRAEALTAARALGVTPLGFADRPARTLKADLGGALAEIRAAVAHCTADTLWVPAWEGGHQDHDAANFLAAQLSSTLPVVEFAEYNLATGVVRSQRFPADLGGETVLQLTAGEAARKRALLALYRSEHGNLAHVGTTRESLRPLPRHDYAAPPHAGRLFRERFHWIPFAHPRVDFEPSTAVREALARGLG